MNRSKNPYLGPVAEQDRRNYWDTLMSGVDEQTVRQIEGNRAIGGKEFTATLNMERATQSASV
jgi:hypothetical protein